MNTMGKLLALAAVVLFVGCSAGVQDNPVEVTPTGANAKIALEGIAESGQLTSDVMTIEDDIAALKESDPAKAEALEKDLEELKAMSKPAEIKKKAAEMAGKF